MSPEKIIHSGKRKLEKTFFVRYQNNTAIGWFTYLKNNIKFHYKPDRSYGKKMHFLR